MSKQICFPIRLDKDEWDPSSLSWRCRALEIPGAYIQTLRIEGIEQHSNHYAINELGYISITKQNYSVNPETDRVVVVIGLAKQLTDKSEVSKWKIIGAFTTVIIAPIATLLSPIGAEYYKQTQNHKDYIPTTSITPPPTTSITPPPTTSITPPPTTSITPPLTTSITPPPTTSITPPPSTSITPPPSTSITPPPSTSTTQDKLFNKYPLEDCGAVPPDKKGYHRVFVPSKGKNLKTLRDEFCKDAFDSDNKTKIVLASFFKKDDADIFLEDIKRFFPDAASDQIIK